MDFKQIWKVLSDEKAVKILQLISKTPRSSKQISDELKIPLCQCYRTIHVLEKMEFIHIDDRIVDPDHGSGKYYCSDINSFRLVYEIGERKLNLMIEHENEVINIDVNERIMELSL